MSDGATEETVEGDVERITYESSETGFRVVKLRVDGREGTVAVVGYFPRVTPGARLRVRGTWTIDPKHGEQIKAASVTELSQTTLAGIEKALGSGMIPGVGEGFARRIVERFKERTLDILDHEPHRLLEVSGLGRARADAIEEAWKREHAIREVMLFLQTHGASPALAARIVKQYGPRAAEIVGRDPYRLALDIWGVGFKTADRIAQATGIDARAPRRFEAAALQAIDDRAGDGHTTSALDALEAKASQLLEMPADEIRGEIDSAVERLEKSKLVVTSGSGSERLVASAKLDAAEMRLAERLVLLTSIETQHAERRTSPDEAIAQAESVMGIELSEEQSRAVRMAATHRALVLTGGPGVGKTTIVRAIVTLFESAGKSVRLAAPTGRAAKRLGESTGRQGTTVHRLLDFDPKQMTFRRNASRPIEGDVVIVDEASMLDVLLADALCQAVPLGAHLVLVGDVDQLPSVGPGAVLRDIIDSEAIACVRLTQIFRQAEASHIVRAAHRVRQGESFDVPARGDESDFFAIVRRQPEEAKATILELVTRRIPSRFGFDPIRDIQVLTPMHRGPVGAILLNAELQARLNPNGESIKRGSRLYRVGDKVMQLRNDPDRDIFNGDIGWVESVDAPSATLSVRFDDRAVECRGEQLEELVLAYAASIHKSQGSEYPVVVIPLLSSHYVMLSRNLLYTALTRGRKLVVLVHDERAVALALGRETRADRQTSLREKIAAALVKTE